MLATLTWHVLVMMHPKCGGSSGTQAPSWRHQGCSLPGSSWSSYARRVENLKYRWITPGVCTCHSQGVVARVPPLIAQQRLSAIDPMPSVVIRPQGVLYFALCAVHLSDGWPRNRQGLIPDSGVGAVRVVGHVNTRHRHMDSCWPFNEAAAVQH